jgi:hypothetical protein
MTARHVPDYNLFLPRWFFDGVTADIREWDGTMHTVTVEMAGPRDMAIVYCDGLVHLVSRNNFFHDLRARVHHFSHTLLHSNGQSSRHRAAFWHAPGCECRND